MVVLCAAILSKSKTLLSRQFVPLGKLRVEALLSHFLTLIETSDRHRARTVLESDSVKYLFVPVESVYLILITDKSSNILVDAETLRSLQQIVVDIVQGSITSEAIWLNGYKILYAMDELLGSGGHREWVSVAQIKEYLAMESAEEKLQNLIRESKEAEEAERRRRKAQELDREKLKRIEAEKAFQKATRRAIASSPTANVMMSGSVLSASPSPASTVPETNVAAPPRKGMMLNKKRPAIHA